VAKNRERDTFSFMVKVAAGRSRGLGAWRGRLLLLAGGFGVIANACGGRTVWVEELGEAGESGSAGVSGSSGDSGGGYGGDYGGGGVSGTSGYGGSRGGYGGVTGGVAGTYGGGGYPAGSAGYSGSGGYPGGFAGSGGFSGTGFSGIGGVSGSGAVGGFGGTAGTAGRGGCAGAAGAGGAGGSVSLGKACSYFCSNFPSQSCPSDFGSTPECNAECLSGFGIDAWCHYALVDFLICAGGVLNPGAVCMVGTDGQCYGPGCTVDAVTRCGAELDALTLCLSNPRPPPPCPPPPPRPLPPNCGQASGIGPDYCSRETSCPNQNYLTECYPQYDVNQTWYCECYFNGVYQNSVTTNYQYPDTCQAGAALCGYY
jgi:hypothetical protein